ncbi:LOW QUALITY PROTEIN: hypothetical protein PHMEG_00016998, partial [Phytophthora megakarya]
MLKNNHQQIMRFSYTLLVVGAASLFTSGCPQSQSRTPLAEVSTFASPDLIASGPPVGENKSLRYLTNSQEEAINNDEEERQGGCHTHVWLLSKQSRTHRHNSFATLAQQPEACIGEMEEGKKQYRWFVR